MLLKLVFGISSDTLFSTSQRFDRLFKGDILSKDIPDRGLLFEDPEIQVCFSTTREILQDILITNKFHQWGVNIVVPGGSRGCE